MYYNYQTYFYNIIGFTKKSIVGLSLPRIFFDQIKPDVKPFDQNKSLLRDMKPQNS